MGRSGDTTLGGDASSFPRTTTHLVQTLQDKSPEVRRGALERLCRMYWKPVYAYARRSRAQSNEEAKDVAQAFFLWILETGRLARYDASRGSFRGFLKMLLKGFMADREDAVKALKRGGGVKVIALPDGPLPDPGAADEDEQQAFDRQWKLEVLKRAMQRVREGLAASGREIQFRAFREYSETDPATKPTYAGVAARIGCSEGDVRNYLHNVRRRIRDEVRAELAETVSGAEALEDEWKALFGSEA